MSLPVLSPENKGQLYRGAADAITYGRTVAGVVAAGVILGGDRLPTPEALQHETWVFASGIGVLGALDKVDGWLARKAEEHGVPITDADKSKDPLHDKIFTHLMMGSIAAREYIDGNKAYAAAILVNQAVTAIRDKKMTDSRSKATGDIAAIPINKYKTGMQNLGHTIATSPIVASPLGMFISAGVYSLSTAMGLYGYKQADTIHRSQAEEKKSK